LMTIYLLGIIVLYLPNSQMGKLFNWRSLSVISFEILKNVKNIKKAVTQEYQKIRENLQIKITHKGSKLQLTLVPEWNIWYKEDEQILIFAFHQYDLMYAADIEFIVDTAKERITDVFAREWFKGE